MAAQRFSLALALLGLASLAHAQTGASYNVRQYGASGGGSILDTGAFERAVAAAASGGGGTVFVPAGTYLTGTIRLRDNITLWLDAGARILGTTDVSQYQSSRGTDEWYKALVLAGGAHNVAVMGRGVIDGNRVFNPKGEEHIRGPHAVLFDDCTNVSVRDIHVQDAGNYAIILRSVEGVDIDGVTVHGGWDGVNMHDVRNGTIANSRLFTGDDSLAGAYWENVTVSNCILNSACNPVRVGGRNVLISNCIMYGPSEAASGTSLRRHTEAGFQILPQNTRARNKYVTPGPVDNMVLSNNTMINVRTPFFVAYSSDASYSANNLGVNRIVIENLTVRNAGRTPFYISAPADNPAKSIVLRNVHLSFAGGGSEMQGREQGFSPFSILQSYAVYARNVEEMELHDVRADYGERDARPPIFGENIGTLLLDRFQAQREPGEPLLELAGIRKLTIDGKAAPAASARVTPVEAPHTVGPFTVTATATSAAEGLASVSIEACGERHSRSVWLNAGEPAAIAFLNLRCKENTLPQGREPAAPFRTFHNVAADLRQIGDDFYIKAAGDYPVMEYGDQYGAIYRPHALGEDGSIVVKLSNPDMRTNWVGRAGIMVRTDIAGAGRAPGYAILSSSPTDGSYLEWDAAGKGTLDSHTEIEGYSIWPHWLKLERRGRHFTGYESEDAAHWRKIGEADVPGATGPLDAGLFTYRDSALFENFRIESNVTH
jgi:hypothetical protein